MSFSCLSKLNTNKVDYITALLPVALLIFPVFKYSNLEV